MSLAGEALQGRIQDFRRRGRQPFIQPKIQHTIFFKISQKLYEIKKILDPPMEGMYLGWVGTLPPPPGRTPPVADPGGAMPPPRSCKN